MGGARPWNRLLERVAREWNSLHHCFRQRWAFRQASEGRRGKCCPFCKYSESRAVGETVPSAAPGTRLRLRARCSGYSVGRRSPLEPATRKGSPGVEVSTGLLSTVMGAKFELRQASAGGNAARFSNTASSERLLRLAKHEQAKAHVSTCIVLAAVAQMAQPPGDDEVFPPAQRTKRTPRTLRSPPHAAPDFRYLGRH